MADPAVTGVPVNSPDRVSIERFGRPGEDAVRFRDSDHPPHINRRVAARSGRHVAAASPTAAALPYGNRVNATPPPGSRRVLAPCPSAPTFFVRLLIDVVLLDRGRVVAVRRVRP